MAKKTNHETTSIHLTEQQAKVLRFLVEGYESGATPSIRKVCEHFEWSSPNAAHQHMRALAAMGLVELRGVGSVARILPLALRIYGKKPAREV